MVGQDVLQRLDQVLSAHNIVWGVGGSYLLKLHGLYSNPNDLDLWVQLSDMPTIKNIFRDYEIRDTNIYLPEEYHYKIKYYGADVDFVAAFIIKPNRNRYEYLIDPESLSYFKLENGVEIPCTLLEDWYVIYRLLKRNDKADYIKDYFIKNNIKLNNRLQNSLHSNIPEHLKRNIKQLLDDYKSSRQITIWDILKEKNACR